MHAEPPRLNFPHYTTSLIGRDADAAAIAEQLLAAPGRLLTLVGTSGTGKTRLSLQVAERVLPQIADGAAFVALTPITDPALVLPTIAHSLDLREAGATPIERMLAQHLGERQMLLILDNMEQVVAAAPDLALLLAGVPSLRVLVTSQVALGIPEETTYPVPPLAVPESRSGLEPEQLLEFPAVALFVERMRRVQPGFKLDKANASAVRDICARLRGLPLAIELVAAHSLSFKPADLLLLLRATLAGAGHSPATPEAVLHPVLDWCVSYAPPAAQALLPRLAVFLGGWDDALMRAVCLLPSDKADLASGLGELTKKLLVQQEQLDGDEVRYGMLDAIRQYALRRLQRDEEQQEQLRERHAQALLALAEEGVQGMRSPELHRWSARLEREMPNIRAALGWLLDHGHGEHALRIASAMSLFWHRRGYLREGERWVDLALAACGELPPELAANAAYAKGLLIYSRSDYAAALEQYDRALALSRMTGDEALQVRLLNNRAIILHEQANYPAAVDSYQAALAIHEINNDRWGCALVLNNLGMLHTFQSRFDDARAAFERALELRRELSDTNGIASTMGNLALCHLEGGDAQQARAMLEESLGLLRGDGQDVVQVTDKLDNLALVELREGRLDHARQRLAESLRLRREIDHARGIGLSLGWFARLAQQRGEHERAATLLGAARALMRQLGATFGYPLSPQIDALEAALIEELGDERLGVLLDEGASLPAPSLAAELAG